MRSQIKMCFRVNKKERDYLHSQAQKEGFISVSKFIQKKILPTRIKKIDPIKDFRYQKLERRSFTCPKDLWEKMEEQNADKKLISQFIREAIREKLKKGS